MTDEMKTVVVGMMPHVKEIKAKKPSPLERGMTTVEYALGILCAGAVVMVVLRIINSNPFFDAVAQWITNMIHQLIHVGG